MIPRLCHHKFKPENYQLPSVPQHGKNKLVTSKLCEQLYRPPSRHDFDATTPREYMKPVLMEYNSLFDPHLKSYFYRPGLTQKLVQNGFVTEDLDVLMPLRTYNVFRKFMENEFLKTHREKAEHFEPKINKARLARKALKGNKTIGNHERDEKRRQFLFEQQQLIRLRKMRLEEEHIKEMTKKEEELKRRKLVQEKLELERDAERERLKMTKLERIREDYLRRKSIHAKEIATQEIRFSQLQERRQKEREDQSIKREKLLQQHEEHFNLMHVIEEEEKAKVQQLKLERIKQRGILYLTMQQREEEKKKKLMDLHQKECADLKREADQFEKHWKEIHDHEIVECHRNIQRKQEFWLRRISQFNQQHANKGTKEESEHKKHGSMINCFQSSLYYHSHHDSASSMDTVKSKKEEEEEEEDGRGKSSLNKKLANSDTNLSIVSIRRGEKLNHNELSRSAQEKRRKTVTFGQAECVSARRNKCRQ